MQLDGIHHITAVTGDARANVAFYTRTLGLKLVKKTVNQDDPTVYHLFYADDAGSAGADLTFFEYPGAARGRAGAGMVHRIGMRVGSEDALTFWADRLEGAGLQSALVNGRLRFADPEGLGFELRVSTQDDPLRATATDIPTAFALTGFDGVRAYARDPAGSRALFESLLGFAPLDDGWEARGPSRGGTYAFDPAPGSGLRGAGTVHHVAWACSMDTHDAWQRKLADAGVQVTDVIDRFYFRSIYFREPSGVLFEIATQGPGFGADEDPAHLGERLSLPPAFEHLRDQLATVLTPLS